MSFIAVRTKARCKSSQLFSKLYISQDNSCALSFGAVRVTRKGHHYKFPEVHRCLDKASLYVLQVLNAVQLSEWNCVVSSLNCSVVWSATPCWKISCLNNCPNILGPSSRTVALQRNSASHWEQVYNTQRKSLSVTTDPATLLYLTIEKPAVVCHATGLPRSIVRPISDIILCLARVVTASRATPDKNCTSTGKPEKLKPLYPQREVCCSKWAELWLIIVLSILLKYHTVVVSHIKVL